MYSCISINTRAASLFVILNLHHNEQVASIMGLYTQKRYII